MKTLKFLTDRDGFSLYQIAEVENEKADQYLTAGQAIEVENGIGQTQTQADDSNQHD